MECNSLTPLLVYKGFVCNQSYKDLIKYGLTPDQASRKANIYCVKNTWRFLLLRILKLDFMFYKQLPMFLLMKNY